MDAFAKFKYRGKYISDVYDNTSDKYVSYVYDNKTGTVDAVINISSKKKAYKNAVSYTHLTLPTKRIV